MATRFQASVFTQAFGYLPLQLGLVAIMAAAFVGCRNKDEIEAYSVPKPHILAKENPARTVAPGHGAMPAAVKVERRMLGAMIPREKKFWFFKVTGSNEQIAGIEEPFNTLIKSVVFPAATPDKPTWTMPAEWNQKPPAGMRYATITLPGAVAPEKVEISVIPLPRQPGGDEVNILSNINRWRGELSLAPISAAQIPEQSATVALAQGNAILVDYLGSAAVGGGGMRGPMQAGGLTTPPRSTGPPSPGPQAGSPLTFESPAGWIQKPNSSMRKASFDVVGDGQSLDISIIDLPPSDPLANVNRWRDEIKLPPIDQATLDKEMRKIAAGPLQADYIEIDGTAGESIYAAIIVHQGRAWFIKLKGPTSLAKQQSGQFEKFVQSLRFP